MTKRARFLRMAALFGAAAVGLLVAHELDYRLVVPDPAHRHDLLIRTGHGYWQHAVIFALLAGILALVATLIAGAGRARSGGVPALTPRRIVPVLAMVQSGGFVLLEATERMLVGAPPDDKLLAITGVGVAVQIATACIGGLLLALLERGAAFVASALAMPARGRHAGEGFAPGAPVTQLPARPIDGAVGVRGPPRLVA